VVFGDSVAFTLASWVLPMASSYGVALGNGAMIGCGVALGSALRVGGGAGEVPPTCRSWPQDWQGWVDAARPAVSIILLGRWEMLDRRINGRWLHLGQPGFDDYLAGQLDRAITVAGSMGAAVVVCTAPYYSGPERPQGGPWPEDTPARVDRFNQLVRAAVSHHAGVTLFDLNALVSPGGHFTPVINGRAIRTSDGVHFSPAGGVYVAPYLLPLVVELGRGAAAGRPVAEPAGGARQ
jgi:hypothetical protein